jgi:hypothetical protein
MFCKLALLYFILFAFVACGTVQIQRYSTDSSAPTNAGTTHQTPNALPEQEDVSSASPDFKQKFAEIEAKISQLYAHDEPTARSSMPIDIRAPFERLYSGLQIASVKLSNPMAKESYNEIFDMDEDLRDSIVHVPPVELPPVDRAPMFEAPEQPVPLIHSNDRLNQHKSGMVPVRKPAHCGGAVRSTTHYTNAREPAIVKPLPQGMPRSRFHFLHTSYESPKHFDDDDDDDENDSLIFPLEEI